MKHSRAVMGAAGQHIHYSREEFSDAEGYVEQLDLTFGISGSSMQLEPGQSQTRFESFSTDDGSICLGRTGISLSELVEFHVPRGTTLISASPESQAYFCNGYKVDAVKMSVYPGGYDYVGVYPTNWNAIDILISNKLLRKKDLLRTDLMRASRKLELRVAEEQGELASQLINNLSKAFDAAARGADSDSIGIEMFELLLSNLRPATDEAFPRQEGRNTRPSRRADIFFAALSAMRQQSLAQLSAEELAEKTGVQYRSLHYAFRDATGISPYRFILIARLHAVRQALLNSAMPVKDIGYSHGFDTPSRFRMQYKRLFGELPSATRERQRQRAH